MAPLRMLVEAYTSRPARSSPPTSSMIGWATAWALWDFIIRRNSSLFCWWKRSRSNGSRANPSTTRMLLNTSLSRCSSREDASMLRWLILRMRWLSFLMGSTTRGPAMNRVRDRRQFITRMVASMARAMVISRTASANWLEAMPCTAPTSLMQRWSSSPTGCRWK